MGLGQALLVAMLTTAAAAGLPQESSPSFQPELPAIILHPVTSIQDVAIPTTGGILGNVRCDPKGGLYLRLEFSPLVRISADGQRVVAFNPDAVPDLRTEALARAIRDVEDFTIAPDGDVYILMRARDSSYVLQFDPDGHYQSKVKLPDFFYPSRLAVFADGRYLIAGGRKPAGKGKAWEPFTGIFDADGQLVRKLAFRSDPTIVKQQTEGKERGIPQITTGNVVTLNDGNAYIMRRFRNPVVIVVSPAGDVLRTITITSPKGFEPGAMSVANDNLLFSFQKREDRTVTILYGVYDPADGREIARYLRGDDVKAALACFSDSVFTFIGVRDGKRVILHARP